MVVVKPSRSFWDGRRTFVTGQTGFKGSWLCLWLARLGARVTGLALTPSTRPSLFESAQVADHLEHSLIADVRDRAAVAAAVEACRPQVVFHMAAQPLVRESYRHPVETFETNVMGTVNLLEAVRGSPGLQAVVVVTTDKVYANPGGTWCWPFRESDPLGASDPYSSSKACSELVAASYAASFAVGLATARSGNVLGGGDWSAERLIPDCIRAFERGQKVPLRFPDAVRPWQHVLDALRGYILLAQSLVQDPSNSGGAWNFSPRTDDALTVEQIVAEVCRLWGHGAEYGCQRSDAQALKEAGFLTLDHSRAAARLGWRPLWNIGQTLAKTVAWYRSFIDDRASARALCERQIDEYEAGL